MKNAYIVPNHSGPTMAVGIDESLCIGCNSCANICRIQTILPNPEKGKPPIVAYPDECWYCGVCVEACPTGALEMRLPINQRVFFRDKETGEVFRIGGSEAPEKTYFRPPYGWLTGNEMNALFRDLEQKKEITFYVSPGIVTEVGRWFGEKEKNDNGGRIAALLRKFGFSRVFLSDEPAESGITVYAGESPKTATYNMDARMLSNFLHRGCTSNTTAVKVWRETRPEEFDR